MGDAVRRFDWSATPLGPLVAWGSALRVSVDMLLSSTFPGCLFWGPDLIAIYNDGYKPMLGDKPEALGQPMRVTWPEAWVELKPLAEKALAGESTFIEDFPMHVDRHGFLEDAWFTFCYSPIFDEHGEVVAILDTVVETTAKVLAERRSRDEQQRQQQLLEQMPGFVGVLGGPSHVFTYANEAYRRIAGHRPLIGRAVREAFPDLAGQGFFELLDRVHTTGESLSLHAVPLTLAGDPVQHHIDLMYEAVRNDKGEVSGVFVGGYDVTERVQAETRLRELNADLEQRVLERTLARGRTWQLSPELLGVINGDGFFELSNPAWQVVLGWSEAEIAGTFFIDFIHPEDQPHARTAWADATERGLPALRLENRYRTKAGGWRWLSWVAVPDEGRIYCSARDIEEEKAQQHALAQAQDALRQAQKMEAVGQLTGGLAHDFNNLLAGISGSLELMRRRLAEGRLADQDRLLNMAQGATRRAAALTHRLLAFSRQQTLDPRHLDLNRLVDGMLDMIRRTLNLAITLDLRQQPDLGGVFADPGQLENTLLNLCINARDAMPQGGTLRIETGQRELGAAEAEALQLSPGRYITLEVGDTGTGMSAETLARVFEPFFTTKPLGAGTGLGLSMVYGFARQSGGQVHIRSALGQGTQVCLYLPRDDRAAPPAIAAPAAAAPAARIQGAGTALLVDDETTVRLVLAELLDDLGFRVITVADGPQALAALGSRQAIDLLVTDVGLPGGLNGRQVADAARETRPDIKVLFITGYAEQAVLSHGHLSAGMQLLTKPFELDALARKVKALMAG